MTISVKENGVWVERKSYAKTANVFKNVTPSQKVNNTYVSSKPKPNSSGPAVAFEIKAGNVTFNITNLTKPVYLQLRNTVTDAVTALGSYTSGAKTVTVPTGDNYHLEFTTELVSTTSTTFIFNANALISKIVSFDDNLYKLDGMPRTQSSALVQVPEALPVSVTNMQNMFYGATSFNDNISSWNTANVTNMSFMFYGATSFNQDLSTWDTGNVTNMDSMFLNATSFNGNISTWNTSNVTNMIAMFYSAKAFNQNISGWDVAKVTTWANFRTGGCPLTTNNTPSKFR